MRVIDGPVDLDDPVVKAAGIAAARAKSNHSDRQQQLDRRRTSRPNRSQSNARGWARPGLTWVAGALVFFLSFIIALRLTQPAIAPTPAMTALAASTISNLRTLMAAVKAAGLKGTPDVKGGLEEIRRLDDGRVAVRGWAAQIADGGSPLTVMVFADGRNELTMKTQGSRPEITDALGLSGDAAENVAFQGTLTCSRGQKLIIVAVAQSDVYGYFGSRSCP